MRASEIYNKAKQDIIAFATSQAEHIRDWNIQTGVWEKNESEEDFYTIDPWEYGYKEKLRVEVDFHDTYSLESFYTEMREVKSIRLYNDGVALELEGLDEDEPIYLHALAISETTKVSNCLEEIFMGLIHPKKSN